MPDSMIELHQVVKKFKNAAGEFTVLKGVDLTLRQHEFVAIVGKSGSGKSTLLNMMTGIDHPTTGRVMIGGEEIYTFTESRRSLWRGRNLGIVFQFFQLLPTLTLLENVMLPMDYVNYGDFDARPRRALELLERVGLGAQAHKLPAAVSTGQQQSAAIARALATDPPILVADEPTGNLDSRAADVVINLFDELAKQGKTIVMVTHDPSLTERVSRTVIISDGELVDETVAQALPLLSHRQMLGLTRQLEPFTYAPGELILQPNQHVDYLFLIAEGAVDVLYGDQVRARLERGEVFGEMELLSGHPAPARATVRAATPVRLVALHRAPFTQLVADSPLTAEALQRIMQRRLGEGK